MTKIQALVLVFAMAGCSESVGGMLDGGGSDAQEADATQDASPDGGGTDAGTDADSPDAGQDADRPDAGRDSGTAPDASSDDAGDAAVGTDAATTDGGTDASASSAPTGAAVDLTGDLCALDEVGSFWCWGRWAVGEVRYLGTGYVDAAGTCARHSDGSVDCADFTTMTMLPVSYGLVGLTVDRVVEYSTYELGCGVRARPDLGTGWQQAFCWTDGTSALHLSTDITQAVGVSAESPRQALPAETCGVTPSAGDAPDAIDINGTHCMSQYRISDGRAMRTLCGSSSMPRATGDHHILGFHHDCAHGGTQTTCQTGGSTPLTLDLVGTFHDHAIAYTGTGTAGLVDGEAVYCVSDDAVRCYTRDAAGTAWTASYTVVW